MDAHVYHPRQASDDKPGLPDSVLSAFVEAIKAIDVANNKTSKDYVKEREFIYFFRMQSLSQTFGFISTSRP